MLKWLKNCKNLSNFFHEKIISKIKKVKDLKNKKNNEREVELNNEEPDEEEIVKQNLKIEK